LKRTSDILGNFLPVVRGKGLPNRVRVYSFSFVKPHDFLFLFVLELRHVVSVVGYRAGGVQRLVLATSLRSEPQCRLLGSQYVGRPGATKPGHMLCSVEYLSIGKKNIIHAGDLHSTKITPASPIVELNSSPNVILF
jgi:hypothetical protein